MIDVTNSSDDDLHLVSAAFWPDCYRSCGASNTQAAEEELKPTQCGYICVGKTNVSHPDVNFTVHQDFDKNWTTQMKRLEVNDCEHCWWGWRGYDCVWSCARTSRRLKSKFNRDPCAPSRFMPSMSLSQTSGEENSESIFCMQPSRAVAL